MEIIRGPLPDPARGAREILLPADRLTLVKRRWRGMAADGREFGFDLAEALADGDPFFQNGEVIYRVAQQPEPVLEIPLGAPVESARIGWMIGNLHFSIEVCGDLVRVVDDPALRQMLARERLQFFEVSHVFHPMAQMAHGHVH